MYCQNCGSALSQDARFCQSCGKAQSPAQPLPPVPPPPIAAPIRAIEPTKAEVQGSLARHRRHRVAGDYHRDARQIPFGQLPKKQNLRQPLDQDRPHRRRSLMLSRQATIYPKQRRLSIRMRPLTRLKRVFVICVRFQKLPPKLHRQRT